MDRLQWTAVCRLKLLILHDVPRSQTPIISCEDLTPPPPPQNPQKQHPTGYGSSPATCNKFVINLFIFYIYIWCSGCMQVTNAVIWPQEQLLREHLDGSGSSKFYALVNEPHFCVALQIPPGRNFKIEHF